MIEYLWLVYLIIGFAAGIIASGIVWYSKVWGILHIKEIDEGWCYTIELTGPFEEVTKNKYVVLRTSHK